MILKVREWPDPILLVPCADWQFASELQPAALYDNLIDTIKAEDALGLAANQIGVPFRVMAMHVQQTGDYVVLFNPCLLEVDDQHDSGPEMCLSFPGVKLQVARPRAVLVEYQDRFAVQQRSRFEGIDARCFLHELDHLNGITFNSHVSGLKFRTALQRARKK